MTLSTNGHEPITHKPTPTELRAFAAALEWAQQDSVSPAESAQMHALAATGVPSDLAVSIVAFVAGALLFQKEREGV